MTQRLYYFSDQLAVEVQVISCHAQDALFAIELDATPFHPQGGGQPSDTGSLGEVEVVQVRHEEGRIVHYVTNAIKPGRTIAQVDENRRRLHTHLHSAGHLIGHIGEAFGWHPVKAHHWPGEGRIEFIPGPEAQPLEAWMLLKRFEQLVTEDLPVTITLDEEGLREVRFGSFSPYGCGGTHVPSLGSLNSLSELALKEKKGRLYVHYDVTA
ncbi:Ser-tRNA(Ala) deacylase AlaX [Pseudomonas duriflava]|uniref:Ser-tRNA(Ala) deacylase AlaX n=1 Tax=Pseudomonas duriflava TaxID=459528 RepID=A0A562Q714_9PSED|nr:alanyl-tRNA editing protein [Pseudomonas duriflava]TWI52555.1 Ser-tRNA(Ala) deacylase AlaX [Pseudomonas duriflava]